jgi:hypothetical protein
VWIVSDSLLANEITGHFDDALIAPYLRIQDEWYRRKGRGLRSFHQWSKLVDYDMSVRFALTEWVLRRIGGFDEIHILTNSKLVLYGIRVANIALRGLVRTYDEPRGFDDAFARATRP